MEFPRCGGEGQVKKVMENPGGGGKYCEDPWNGKFCRVGGQTGKTLGGGMDIFWNHSN